jgi:hypothetical protein
MQTREKGNLTEAKILAALLAAGYLVSIPFGEGHKYDFIIDDSVSLWRVQCKTGRVKKEPCCLIVIVSRVMAQLSKAITGWLTCLPF